MHPCTDRRQFVTSLVGGATAGLLPTFAPVTVQAAAQGDFLMTNGPTYLNTGTIGPSRRATVEATQPVAAVEVSGTHSPSASHRASFWVSFDSQQPQTGASGREPWRTVGPPRRV